MIEVRSQAADHPALLSAPETEYLTCVMLRVE
jgi:23S rRNA G2069 N7-methylase RlmK/C1962 C5-methylase RlmI